MMLILASVPPAAGSCEGSSSGLGTDDGCAEAVLCLLFENLELLTSHPYVSICLFEGAAAQKAEAVTLAKESVVEEGEGEGGRGGGVRGGGKCSQARAWRLRLTSESAWRRGLQPRMESRGKD